jgi:hypothetical protein
VIERHPPPAALPACSSQRTPLAVCMNVCTQYCWRSTEVTCQASPSEIILTEYGSREGEEPRTNLLIEVGDEEDGAGLRLPW